MALKKYAFAAVFFLLSCQTVPPSSLPLANTRAFQGFSAPQQAAPLRAYLGNLHSHTGFSDGVETPAKAYEMAKRTGMEFFAITEHNHSAAGGNDGIHLTPQLYEELKRTAQRYSQRGEFAALYGQEFSTISRGNHVNVFNADTIIDVENGDFKTLYERWLPQHPEVPFIQMNHPNYRADMGLEDKPQPAIFVQDEHGHEAAEEAGAVVAQSSKQFNDYGYDDYQRSFQALVQVSAPYIKTLEILNGPGTSQRPVGKAEAFHEEDFLFYLNEGFRVAPTADQDNHFVTWGTLHTGRTGVLANDLTPASLYDAIRRRRVFATEDANTRVFFFANNQPMGAEMPWNAQVQLTLNVQDGDEPQAAYLIQIFMDQPGGRLAVPVREVSLQPGQTEAALPLAIPAPGTFVFAKIIQQNPGGVPDETWTAPIWFD
ncbi:MAG: CehA/McbA family metallohydrolase [Candidatus Sericytochromatia bacterium]|nr:CehA/McbA family metallohydrolase [Candidatus Sericytochromatia bacterium]